MVIPQTAARDALECRLRSLFGCDAFQPLFPSAVKAPSVSIGFPVNEPPFYVAVDEIVDDLQPGSGATCGQVAIKFRLTVYACARHSDLLKAADTATSYAHAAILCVLADQTLGGSVDHAVPSITGGGTAADGDRKYIATEVVSVECDVWAMCPQEVRDAVEGAM